MVADRHSAATAPRRIAANDRMVIWRAREGERAPILAYIFLLGRRNPHSSLIG